MNGYKFSCPHCSQHLEAPPEMLGQTVECPACKGPITVPRPAAQPQGVQAATPPPVPTGRAIPQTCPLCGSGRHMNDVRTLYGHVVCRKCYYAFANRRQLAYILDILGFYAICFVAGLVLGLVMGAGGASQSEVQSAGFAIGWLLLPLLFFKDCFSGQSLGKGMCGVKVIDETTGKPGGLGASFKRNLPLVVPFMPLVVAVQLGRGHRTGDGWSNTKVIWKKYANSPIFAPVPATP